MTIGERIFQLLREKAITQKEFSERTGIAQSTISDWKHKKLNPSSDKIMIICEVLQISPSELLTGTSEEKWPVDYMVIQKNSEEYQILEEIRGLSQEARNRLVGYLQALQGK